MKALIATAMYPSPDRPAWGTFVRTQVEALKRAGIEIELLVLEGRPRKLIYPRGVFQLRQRLQDDSIDLVHAHYGYVGMVARTQWKVPVVVTYHGDDLLGTRNPEGEITPFSRLMAMAGAMLGRVVDAAIVQSKQMASKINGPNVHIIPHEVDFDLFHPTERGAARSMLGLDPHRKYLLFAADPRIPVKRFPLAQAAADHLRARDPDVELVVVYRETQDRLALYMSACDALVFPSYQEGSPNVVKQAMACNLPIVATDVGDVREVIGNTEGCYICGPTVEEFGERLCQVLQRRERTRGREEIRHLDSPTVTAKVVQVYEQVLMKRVAGERDNARRAA